VKHGKRMTDNHEWFQLIAIPIKSPRGVPYVMVFKNSYRTTLQIYGLLPGYTTMTISCVVTLFLAFLMALPIRRLRTAAGEIAVGKLDARVLWNSPTARFTGGDDIDQLCTDFNHMAGRLQSLADAQRLLLCEVSHELRSPLARMSVGLGLARTESSPAMKVHLDRIGDETVRLNGLIDQILSLSRLDLLHEIDGPRLISLSQLVADLLPDMQYEATRSGCVIDATVCSGCFVYGDPALLRTAIENIVRNAIKYAGEGGLIDIEIAREATEGKDMSIVRVSDNGPGVPEHELPSVLKPFYRADRSRHWRQEGSGIGLSIADRAARLHGGVIVLRNKRDGGLVAEIRIPAAERPAQENEAETAYTVSMPGD
jgi:two-component system sensor histidine kinase CpxA